MGFSEGGGSPPEDTASPRKEPLKRSLAGEQQSALQLWRFCQTFGDPPDIMDWPYHLLGSMQAAGNAYMFARRIRELAAQSNKCGDGELAFRMFCRRLASGGEPGLTDDDRDLLGYLIREGALGGNER